MAYKIAIYCPDQHISYDINTLNNFGVGGGITARIRLAHALAREGNQVQLFVNCPEEGYFSDVEYTHYSHAQKINTDIFIASTTGGDFDLRCLNNCEIQAKVKILFIGGDIKPKGFDDFPYDYIYCPSNYLARTVARDWKIVPSRLFVANHGVEDELFEQEQENEADRDDYQLIYASHPSKGLDAAISVFKLLHNYDRHFSLHIYGGYRLWGQDLDIKVDDPGVYFHGLIGQKELASKLKKAGTSINLQSREEPFGMIVIDSMKAGCVVLASPVGAFPELIQNNYNGFLIPGNSSEPETSQMAAKQILDLVSNPGLLNTIRKNASRSPMSWNVIAQAFEQHWKWHIDHSQHLVLSDRTDNGCAACHGETLLLADGLHCINCGNYSRSGFLS